MHEESLNFLDAMDVVCRVSACMSDSEFESVYALCRQMSLTELMRMRHRAMRGGSSTPARPGAPNGGTGITPVPSSTPTVPRPVAHSLPSQIEHVLCHNATTAIISALAWRFPQIRSVAGYLAAYCAGDADIDGVVMHLRSVPRMFGGNSAPLPYVGAGGALLLGAAHLTRDDREVDPRILSIIRSENRANALSALATRPDLMTAPMPPLGRGMDAVINWSRLEAVSRGSRDVALAINGSTARQTSLTVGDAGELAAAIMMASAEDEDG